MKRVLFVDDEVAVLEALRNRLRKQRGEWEMIFATSGEEALRECARSPFDVVVSDMRMPGMDGAALLQRIRQDYPSTTRIVLSGHAEREAVMRALPVAHQYLSKPCAIESLREVIARACALQTLMNDPALRTIVGRVEKLPSVPTLYVELTQVLAREAPTVDDIVKVVERDPAMCIKLLQVINSAFFGLPRRVTAMREVISYLGTEVIKSLVLATQIFTTSESVRGLDAGALAAIQRHSMLVARAARAIARANPEDAFMAGMVHDIGQVVLALADYSRFSEIGLAAKRDCVPLHVAERQRLGVTHAEAGAYVLGTWGVPFAVVEAVAGHHEPARVKSASLDTTTAIHIAQALVSEVDASCCSVSTLDEEHLGKLGLLGEVDGWRATVARICEGARD